MSTFPYDDFADALAANDEYIKTFKYSGLTGTAQKGLALSPAWIHALIPYQLLECDQGMSRFCVMLEHV